MPTLNSLPYSFKKSLLMKAALVVAVLVGCCVATHPAKATVVRCADLFPQITTISYPELRLPLHQLVAEFIEQKKQEYSGSVLKRMSRPIVFNGIEYQRIAILGEGAEGRVHLYESADGHRIVEKVFFESSKLRPNLENLRLLESTGTPVIKVYGLSSDRSIIAEYVAGLNFKEILEAELPDDLRAVFKSAYLHLKSRYPKLDQLNWMLYFDDHGLNAIRVDPH